MFPPADTRTATPTYMDQQGPVDGTQGGLGSSLEAAIATVLAEATWQRCRTHFMANLASRVPKANSPMIATLRLGRKLSRPR
jgi:hypothetical protein